MVSATEGIQREGRPNDDYWNDTSVGDDGDEFMDIYRTRYSKRKFDKVYDL